MKNILIAVMLLIFTPTLSFAADVEDVIDSLGSYTTDFESNFSSVVDIVGGDTPSAANIAWNNMGILVNNLANDYEDPFGAEMYCDDALNEVYGVNSGLASICEESVISLDNIMLGLDAAEQEDFDTACNYIDNEILMLSTIPWFLVEMANIALEDANTNATSALSEMSPPEMMPCP